MADQTVRTIYEAVVNRAQRGLTDLARDTNKAADAADKLDAALEQTGKRDVKPQIDLDIADAEAEVRKLSAELKKLEDNPVDPVIRADVAKSEAEIARLRTEIERLEDIDPQIQIDAEIDEAETRLDAVRENLRDLEAMDATPEVNVQIDKAEAEIESLLGKIDDLESTDAEATVRADVEQAEAQIEGLERRIDYMNRLEAEATLNVSIDQARSDLDTAESKLKALQGAKAEMVVTVDANDAEESLEGLGDAAEDAGDDAGARAGRSLLAGLNSTPVVGAIAGLVAAVGGYVASGVVGAVLESVRQQDVFGARTGLDEATARKFGAAAGLAYTNAWGDSIEANMGTATAALENALVLPDSTGREIQAVIEQLSAVSEILGVDVSEAAEAAGSMIKNGLAANAEEAFDVIIRGQQEGLNRSEDWIDTLREYGAMFESVGLSGAEAGGLIEQAMDAGARNSDVAADALKEFSIRAQDDSKTTRAAFEGMGLDADEMGKKFAAGGDDAKKGLDTVLDGLRGIEDPMARNAAGVALFGTMWEDMGNGAGVLAMDLDDLGDSWVNVGDTTEDAMQRMSDNSATALESAKRTVTTAATNLLGGLAVALEEPIAEATGYISDNTAEIVGFLIDVGEAFFDVARAAVEFGAQTIEALGDVVGGVNGIIEGIGFGVEAIGLATGDLELAALGQDIQDAADDMQTFADNSDDMANTIRGTALPAIDEAEQKFLDFAGPVEMQARLNDAINGMAADLDSFVAHVDSLPGGTITINGDTTGGEEAMNTLIEEVANSDGTLTINGETVQAEDAVGRVMALADEGTEITVTANTAPAEGDVQQFRGGVGDNPADVTVGADTSTAEEDVHVFGSQVGDVPATVIINADTYYGEDQLRKFQGAVNEAGGTVTINGETLNGEQALAALVQEVNAGQGYVDINGTPVNAEAALLQLTDHINNSGGTVDIDGNKVPAQLKTGEVKRQIDGTEGVVDIEGDNSGANRATDSAKRKADGTTGTIDVDANTSGANSDINHTARNRSSRITADATTWTAENQLNWLARNRTSTITVRTNGPGGGTRAQLAYANGGRIASGLASGGTVGDGYGMVPAPYPGPGIDNVLWPLKGAATGRWLDQPLAGGEWVINPVSSAQHNATLAAINAGATRAELAASLGGGRVSGAPSVTNHFHEVGGEAAEISATRVLNRVVGSLRGS
ncbi:phage tail length tape-measure protein [Brachybacterium sp. SW0106-09]|uniref:phage tail tape measure protein n=1 Tax=Brachybacterium sp. SW0106-09 TaxID=1704590 RepID=UPI0006B5520D|nr:phage tail tape measure protein [Brachybacterium sp. SW0106-09]GAP78499.1 phage tail length tape-measure protein [Brachybacterium sp. SW0106-09]